VDLNNVINSIDRTAAPLRIVKVESELASGAYAVGDDACTLVEVDDLTSAFKAGDLKAFEVVGAPAHWSFKDISWDGSKNWFKVCFHVTPAFPRDGLQIRRIAITSEMGRSVECQPRAAAPAELTCSGSRSEYAVVPRLAPVENPAVDLAGPVIESLDLNEQTYELTLVASDPSGLGTADVTVNDQKIIVYPDELAGRKPVDLRATLHPGWNTVSRVVVYDANGFPTMLSTPLDDHGHPVRRVYDGVTWGGQQQATGIQVLYFLVPGRQAR
jgi:hypothetical protein